MKQWGWWLVLWLVVPTLSAAGVVVSTFSAPDAIDKLEFNHLTVDEHRGRVYVGAVNRLYQLVSDLELVQEVETGPSLDSPECSFIECPATAEKKLTDNVNKALVIDRSQGKLISCGSLSQGVCTVRSLENIKNDLRKVQEPVVANNATASTVAFIAPGPSDQTRGNPLVLYVGVTYTGNSYYRAEVPAVSSRSLNPDNTFQLARTAVTTGTRMFVNSLSREKYPIHYIFGFSHEGFSYFLTIQMRFSDGGPSQYISKLVRVCQDDPDYYSYTEIPLECTDNQGEHYSLVQAAYIGKPGTDLASELGIAPEDDALFTVFSKPSEEYSSQPTTNSGLCIYSLKTIRNMFYQNIRKCFQGQGNRGLNFIAPEVPCVRVGFPIDEAFCGMDVNTPLGGEMPVVGDTVMKWDEHLTAVAASSVHNYTIVFLGTANGHLKKVVMSQGSIRELSDETIDEGSAVNADLSFDKDHNHLYVMTRKTVSKVKVQDCEAFRTCSECLDVGDPYCGWCSPERKCSLLSNCRHSTSDPLYWISYKDGRCTTIQSVTPKQLQRTTARTLQLEIENLPSNLEGKFQCAFTAMGKTLLTEAHRGNSNIYCYTPRTDLLPNILPEQHHVTTILSVRLQDEHDFVATNFSFFDCNTYTSCTDCVSSDFPCDWCVDNHRCTHDTAENCRNDLLVTGVSRIGPSIRSGPDFCPRISSTSEGGTEILATQGSTQKIKIRVDNIAQFIFQTQFECQFTIEGRVSTKEAILLGDTIYCEDMTFAYNSPRPNITATFAVIWDNSKPLDNPDNIHVVIYECEKMSDSCESCVALAEKYGCGWCQSTFKCELNEPCEGGWLDAGAVCPNPTLELEHPPSTLQGRLQCMSDSITNCLTTRTDLLSNILQEQHQLTVVLSSRLNDEQEFAETKFTFYDCSSYSSCSECVSSDFSCDWCVDSHSCTHDATQNCRNDVVIHGVSHIGPSFRKGPGYCPRINSTTEGQTQALAAWDSTKQIRVRVDNIAEVMLQTRFECRFNIEGQMTIKEALLVGDVIYCEDTLFTYNSPAPSITADFSVVWGNSIPLDNPDNIHILIYRCQADSCSDCLSLPEEYECGWCQSASRCDVKEQCEGQSAMWLDRMGVCQV